MLVRFSVGDSFAPGDRVVVTPVETADEREFEAEAKEYKSVPSASLPTDALCLPSPSPDIYFIMYACICDMIQLYACMHEKACVAENG